eukprot:6204428-Pleurochrysis_carterae.AAC.1
MEREIILYLLIWGEASNLRFMPELLCFLFEIAREWMPKDDVPKAAPKQFLHKIVTPIYKQVAHRKRRAHTRGAHNAGTHAHTHVHTRTHALPRPFLRAHTLPPTRTSPYAVPARSRTRTTHPPTRSRAHIRASALSRALERSARTHGFANSSLLETVLCEQLAA